MSNKVKLFVRTITASTTLIHHLNEMWLVDNKFHPEYSKKG